MKVKTAVLVFIIALTGCACAGTKKSNIISVKAESHHTAKAELTAKGFSALILTCSGENDVSIEAVMNADTENVAINRDVYPFSPPTEPKGYSSEMHFSRNLEGNVTDLYFDMSKQRDIPLRIVSNHLQKIFICRSGKT